MGPPAMHDVGEKSQIKESLFALESKKRSVEDLMEEIIVRLGTCGCMNDEPLVDEEGYPRGDIDIVSVVHDRKQLKELQNDHKAIMKEMEGGLHRLHALDRRHGDFENNVSAQRSVHVDAEASMCTVDAVTAAPDPHRSFALVDEVSENSPGSDAGLRPGDEVVACNHVTFETPNALQVFSRLVTDAAKESEELCVRVKRGEFIMAVVLKPSEGWGGRGVLGVHLVPRH